MRHVGFTGTRYGMSPAQQTVVAQALDRLVSGEPAATFIAHHGDCVGADAQFHDLTRLRGFRTVGHLPIDDTHRAFCQFDEVRDPLPHMKRNRAIVAESDVVIATPFDMEEKTVGGTWKTIGFARQAKKPLAIVWRDGIVTLERWPEARRP